MDELAHVGFAGDDRRVSGVASANGCFAQIQPKPGFARLFIRTVTTKAIISQDWSNIAEIIWIGTVGICWQSKNEGQQ
jgi:hypothetical protein